MKDALCSVNKTQREDGDQHLTNGADGKGTQALPREFTEIRPQANSGEGQQESPAREVCKRADLFGRAPARPGHLVDYFLKLASDNRIPATKVLAALLDGLSEIWPSGLTVDGVPLGDAGRHRAVRTDGATDQIVPFHKLSQWLTYSLLEPLEMAGLTVERLDELTALPEYRNGGLLLDLGVIRPHAPIDSGVKLDVASEFIVEWRALTVALMDSLLDLVRKELRVGASFTMPHMLQGGTWAAGRKIARQLRPPDGPSPIPVAADGTVF